MKEEKYDVAVVGCGPAGLSAAINVKRRNVSLALLGSDFCSPKLYKAAEINNYLGLYNITGNEMREQFLKHVTEMGIDLKRSRIDNIYPQGDYYTLVSGHEMFNSYTVILAVGVSNEKYLEGEEGLVGKGVSYCATCDGPLYKGRKVAVIAYTEEGIEEADYLSELADTVYFIPQFQFDKSVSLAVEIVEDKPVAINGDNQVESLKLENYSLDVDGIFILREVTPPDKLITGLETAKFHIRVNKEMETNIPGLFAAGDCTGTPYQLGRAVGQGQIAGLNAASYARKKKKEVILTK